LYTPNYVVYSDEGGQFAGAFEAKLTYKLIKHVVSRSSAPFVERSIGTLRDGINVRLNALKQNKSEWYKMIPFVANQYNSTARTTTKVTPDDAAKLDWEAPGGREGILELREAIEGKAHFDVKYPLIAVGDRVKILREPGKYGDLKSQFVAWSEATFRVEEISYDAGNPVFKLEGRSKALRLHEILKVGGVEKAPKLMARGKQGAAAQLRRKVVRPPPLQDPLQDPAQEAVQEIAGEVVQPIAANANANAGRPRMRNKTPDPNPPAQTLGVRRRTNTYDAN